MLFWLKVSTTPPVFVWVLKFDTNVRDVSHTFWLGARSIKKKEENMIFSHLFLALEERLCQIPSIELLKANLAEPKVAVSHFFCFFIFLFGQTALKLSDHESSFMGWRGQIEKKKSLFRNNVFNRRLPSADPLNSSRVQAAQEKK